MGQFASVNVLAPGLRFVCCNVHWFHNLPSLVISPYCCFSSVELISPLAGRRDLYGLTTTLLRSIINSLCKLQVNVGKNIFLKCLYLYLYLVWGGLVGAPVQLAPFE